jgi:hypothetical protein
MKRTITLAALAAGAAATGAGMAEAQGFALSGGIGTTGASVEVQTEVTPYVQLRGGYNYLQYGADDTYDGVAYNGDLNLTTWGAFIDLRPFGNAFIVTAGAYIGDKTLDLGAMPTSNVQIGNQTFTPAQVGALHLNGDLKDNAPFVGLGWDTTFQGDSRIGFKLIAGAMFTDSPRIDLTSTGGSLSNDANFQTQLGIEEQNLRDDIDKYKAYPVLEAGLSFRF